MAAVFLTAATAFVVVIVRASSGPASVETQGTLRPTGTPPITSAPGTAVPPGTRPAVAATVPAAPPPIATSTLPPTISPPRPAPAPTSPPTVARPRPLPTAPPAPVAPAPGSSRLVIDRIGVDAPVVTVGVEPGTNAIEIPGLDEVGWYRYSSTPGDAVGTSVLVGHVDGDGRPGVFAALRDLRPGDRFTVSLPDAGVRTFEVAGLQEFPKQALPTDLFARQGPARLALITCGGPFDRATGHYVDNVVVVAVPVV